MGKAISTLSKPIREFNIESRAHKVISKDKPNRAPLPKASEIAYEEYKKGKLSLPLRISV